MVSSWDLEGFLAERNDGSDGEVASVTGKHQGNGSWCNNPEIYCLKTTDVLGSLNISPTWFQQAHEDWPEAADIFRKPAALEWLDAISQSNSISSTILATYIHHFTRQDVLRRWTSVCNGVAVICNCLTPPHWDGDSRRQWYDLLVTLGHYQNCNLELPGLGLSLEYGPGTVVGLLGATLEHEVPSFDGERSTFTEFLAVGGNGPLEMHEFIGAFRLQ
ncbi:hypothetical protein EI94DRAFT_1696125 [Lactarius quietus]|nr:hypothetical protein EI94DRAFT_1696125 [Lactarius quietus]